MLFRMWNKRNSHSLLVRIQNGTATVEDSLVVSYKTKHKYTLTKYDPASVPCFLPKGVKNLCPPKTPHIDVFSSFIPNCQNLEATKMSFNK